MCKIINANEPIKVKYLKDVILMVSGWSLHNKKRFGYQIKLPDEFGCTKPPYFLSNETNLFLQKKNSRFLLSNKRCPFEANEG